MDFDIDTLFTIVFVVFIILFQFFGSIISRLAKRGRPDSDKTEKPDRSTKEAGLLQTLKSRVSNEIQMAMQQAAAAQGGVGRQLQKTEPLVQTKTAERQARPVLKKTLPRPAVDPTAEEQVVIDEIRKGLLDAAAAEIAASESVAAEAEHAARAGYSREELRRAVIWAEILAPPVALRD